MNPMKEIKITRDFVDELVSQLDEITNLNIHTACSFSHQVDDEEKLRGLFPKPSTDDTNIVHHYPIELNDAKKPKDMPTRTSSLFQDLEVYVAEGAVSAFKPSQGPSSELSPGKYSPQPYQWRKGVNLSKLKKTLKKDPDYFKH